ncbi:NADPH-dependent FMN reductase [Celeribacter sp.]|uniref:NADPH-dependent FMN reductase n=1 Tax=Celeribacter sp. TaxID=1890673 RepID=UPI003A8F8C38
MLLTQSDTCRDHARMNILALSGSARRASTNTALLRNLADVAPEGIDITVFDRIAELPVFSPDLEHPRPASVAAFADLIARADGLILCVPEYARALPGGLKNALDWLVSGEELIAKPVALAHASHRGDDMLADLRRVLTTVTSAFQPDIFLRLSLMGQTPEEIAALFEQPDTRHKTRAFLKAFAKTLPPKSQT